MNNIRALLDSIQSGVQTVSPEKHQQTIAAINKFQDDPALLDTILPRCVPLLTKSFFCMSQRDQKLVAELFYNLDKISHSKVLKSLDTSIFRLNEILNYLQDRASPSSFSDVLCVYLNLSWLSVILLSPYAFKDKFNKTLQVSSRFENYPICIPPINKIKAVLYFKTSQMPLTSYRNGNRQMCRFSTNFKAVYSVFGKGKLLLLQWKSKTLTTSCTVQWRNKAAAKIIPDFVQSWLSWYPRCYSRILPWPFKFEFHRHKIPIGTLLR